MSSSSVCSAFSQTLTFTSHAGQVGLRLLKKAVLAPAHAAIQHLRGRHRRRRAARHTAELTGAQLAVALHRDMCTVREAVRTPLRSVLRGVVLVSDLLLTVSAHVCALVADAPELRAPEGAILQGAAEQGRLFLQFVGEGIAAAVEKAEAHKQAGAGL